MSEDEIKTQLDAMHKLVELSELRTKQSAGRSYMNAERTLSVWIRTALAAMIFGIAIDRLGLMLDELPEHVSRLTNPDRSSKITGAVLVIFSILMALSSGIRFIAFTKSYRKEYPFPAYHKAWLPATYAFMVVFFGIALLILMLCIS